jgi:hypothetical protein
MINFHKFVVLGFNETHYYLMNCKGAGATTPLLR